MKMQNTNSISKVPTIQEFISKLSGSFEACEDACKMLVLMVDANPKIYDEIIKVEPRYSYNLLGNLERVGRGEILFALLCDSSPGARKLLSLPPSQAKAIYEVPVKVVSMSNGKAVVTEKPIQQLSRAEANMAFESTGRPRPIKAQMELVNNPRQIALPIARRYTVIGDKLKVMDMTEFDIPTLEEILLTMKENAIKTLSASMKEKQIKK